MTGRILTVDDSRTMLKMLAFTLQKAGYEVLQAENGQHGLDVLDKNEVDIIITDINMPVMERPPLAKLGIGNRVLTAAAVRP